MFERMRKINEELIILKIKSFFRSMKFDMMRINQLANSPIQSPALHATTHLKN